jgi:hypothetical protein
MHSKLISHSSMWIKDSSGIRENNEVHTRIKTRLARISGIEPKYEGNLVISCISRKLLPLLHEPSWVCCMKIVKRRKETAHVNWTLTTLINSMLHFYGRIVSRFQNTCALKQVYVRTTTKLDGVSAVLYTCKNLILFVIRQHLMGISTTE